MTTNHEPQSVSDSAKAVRAAGEAEHGPVGEDPDHLEDQVARLTAERDRLANVAEGYRVEARIAKGRAERLDAEVRRYLAQFELVTLERDQLRERVGQMATAYEETAAMLRADRQAIAEECGRLIDRLEAIEATNPRRPARAEVADYATERDRLIAANADDRMADDGPTWEPVLTGSIPTGGRGLPVARIHDPDDPVAQAFFTDHPVIPEGTSVGDALALVAERRAALEAQARHDREVADRAEHDTSPEE